MMTSTNKKVEITIKSENLIASILLLREMRNFCREQKADGVSDTVEALNTAIDAMMGFYCLKFTDDSPDEAIAKIVMEKCGNTFTEDRKD